MQPPIQLLLAVAVWRTLHRLGGFGQLLLGLADNSVVPLTGSTDVLTIWLAARRPDLWPYYAFMATVGAVGGGFITYSLARKGGKETLERKMSKRRAAKVCQRFESWGFGGVAIPAILPPPFPIVPFLLAAGALQYSRKKFLAALSLGRATRYTIIAALGARYGNSITAFLSQYYKAALGILIGLSLTGAAGAVWQYLRHQKEKNSTDIAKPPKTA
jgi:membrane protein YqaA with SNARE-associated domain